MRGIKIKVNNDILCREKGVVSPDYICSRYKSFPEPKILIVEENKCFYCENFITDASLGNNTSIGLCRLFSVRNFDGKKKKACSKFIKKQTIEIST